MIALLQRSSLWFFMEDVALNYPAPHMPNTASVGELMSGQPGKPLPPELESFLASGSDAIIVSFGSFFDFLPPQIGRQFCDAFR